MGELALIGPTTLAELREFAASAAKTGFYGAKTAEQALLIAASGRDLGLSYTAALRLFHVIEGRPALSADGMVAIVLASGQCDYFETVESTYEVATVRTRRKGRGERTMSFTLADAGRAGLTGRGNWGKYPAAMLRARAKSALARDVYPDLLAGIYDPDELSSAEPLTEIVEAKAAAVAPAQTAEMMASLCAQLAQATTPEQFAAIAKGAATLPAAERDVFRARFKARKAAIAQPPMEPPPPPFVELGDAIPDPSAPVSEPEPPSRELGDTPAAFDHVAAFADAIAAADSVQALDAVGGQIAAARLAGFEPPAPLRATYRARMTELAARDLA